jgi:DNA-binding NarL/FixJ family response regulator
MKTSIAIAEDHHLFRQALAHMLNAEASFEITGEFEDGREAIEHVRLHQPDILLIDIIMPRLNGMDTIRAIVREGLTTRCLAMSSSVESRTVVRTMEAGACGYVTKSSMHGQLIEAIRTVLAGQKWISPNVTDGFVQHCLGQGGDQKTNSGGNGNGKGSRPRGSANRNKQDHPAEGTGLALLTPREREVLQLLTEGLASKEIAADLNVSVKTVDTHRAALMRKLELHNVAHLTKYAVREGITTLDY